MDIEALEAAVSSLRREMRRLQGEIERLSQQGLMRALRARGMEPCRSDPTDELIFSPDTSAEALTTLYNLLRHYSFRLLLRDLIGTRGTFRGEDLTRYCSLQTAQRYIATLCELKLVAAGDNGAFQLTRPTPPSFGPTLEWFIAEVFKREFASPAMYGLRFKDTPRGGDYDVIALWAGRVVYVEVKSSPPRGVERGEIDAFLDRITDLLPDVAILFNDTQLRMKDKIVLMFEETLLERFGKRGRRRFPLQRLVDELFHINHRIYIVNSKRDAISNFATCLRDFLAEERKDIFPLTL